MSEDPFFIVNREVEAQLESARYLQGQALLDTLLNVAADLDELEETVRIVAADPAAFRLDARAVEERRLVVKDARRLVAELKQQQGGVKGNGLQKDFLAARQGSQKSAKVLDHPLAGPTSHDEAGHQQAIMHRQDETMDAVLSTVGNLREIGRVMGQELDEQAGLLDRVEDRVEQTQSRLNQGIKRINDFIEANADGKQMGCIGILSVVLVVLLFIVFMA